ncbi:MAG TPA: asparagine synthase-related protein [Methylomirabilota bacterium]
MPTVDAPPLAGAGAHHWALEWCASGEAEGRRPGRTFTGAVEAGTLRVAADPEHGLPDLASDEHRVVAFHGHLLNREELAADPAPGDAALVLALMRQGRSVPAVLRGAFALTVWDRRNGSLTIARDQLGLQPIYFARSRTGLACSPSVDALLKIEGVSSDLDPVALAEYLCQRYEPGDGTFYRDLRRVPPGATVRTRNGMVAVETYWDPLPVESPVSWMADEEIDEFPAMLARAVRRCLRAGPAAIFLSGGLDSIGVAALAADEARAGTAAVPLALSLGFQSTGADERDVQRRVAAALRLPQVLLPFDDAVEPSRLIETALRMGEGWPVPMWNLWAAGYEPLARQAREHGCRTVLSGRGGDEWLTVSPYHAADLAKAGRLVALAQLLRSRQRSYQHAGWRYARHLLADRVARPLGSAALDRVAPRWWHQRRRAVLEARRPVWVAPDARVRTAMHARLDRFIADARPSGGFYLRESRAMLRHPAIVGDLEEAYELGRRSGVAMLHPYWDADLAEFLCRTPPRLLLAAGRSKAPLRRLVTERLPGLELARQRKADARGYFAQRMAGEATSIWRRMRGAQALGALGVVDRVALDRYVGGSSGPGGLMSAGRIWEVMALESWVRSRTR